MTKAPPAATCLSMTGFAALRGAGPEGVSWLWDLRSVNGRGLDLRLRLPEGIDGLEGLVRAEIGRRVQRGNVTLSLKLVRDAAAEAPRVNAAALAAALAALGQVQAAADRAGVALAPPSPADILGLRGVQEAGQGDEPDLPALRAALLEDLGRLLDEFTAARAREGAALAAVMVGQIDRIEDLVEAARTEAEARRDTVAASLRDALARVLDTVDADPARVAQELALIALRTDVTEELDRLTAHVAAARALIAAGGALGRKLDFLTQEFNREANTLCSKAQSIALTRIGLDLKHVIDQMREQVQNLE